MCLAISRAPATNGQSSSPRRTVTPDHCSDADRAEPLGRPASRADADHDFSNPQLTGILLQYPATDGYVGITVRC